MVRGRCGRRRGRGLSCALEPSAPSVALAGRPARSCALRCVCVARAGVFGRWCAVGGPESTPCAAWRARGLSGARRPAAGLHSTARRTEPALLWIRHRRMRTRMVVERSVRTVWTGATRAGARTSMKLAGLRPVRGAERGAGSRRPEPAG